jgi:hypothetical protein
VQTSAARSKKHFALKRGAAARREMVEQIAARLKAEYDLKG